MTNYQIQFAGLDIHGPVADDGYNLDKDAVQERIDEIEVADDAIATSDSAFLERFEVDDGTLKIGVWQGDKNGDGWYSHVEVPLLANDDAREMIAELAKPYGLIGGQLDDVTEVVEREVDDYGRINLGRDRAGETVKVALLEND